MDNGTQIRFPPMAEEKKNILLNMRLSFMFGSLMQLKACLQSRVKILRSSQTAILLASELMLQSLEMKKKSLIMY